MLGFGFTKRQKLFYKLIARWVNGTKALVGDRGVDRSKRSLSDRFNDRDNVRRFFSEEL
jgi:hypothetical protein